MLALASGFCWRQQEDVQHSRRDPSHDTILCYKALQCGMVLYIASSRAKATAVVESGKLERDSQHPQRAVKASPVERAPQPRIGLRRQNITPDGCQAVLLSAHRSTSNRGALSSVINRPPRKPWRAICLTSLDKEKGKPPRRSEI